MRELTEKLNKLRAKLDAGQQSYFHLNSVENFLLYYDELNPSDKIEVEKALTEYFAKMEKAHYEIDKRTSTNWGLKYIIKTGKYYKKGAGFKLRVTLLFAIL